MKRSLINLIAVATILMGGWVLSSPAPVAAVASAACCKDCCGKYCWTNDDGTCDACDEPGCKDELN